MILRYAVTFFDYWHLSSGLSAGARLDSSVVKDKDGLPYIPAKTIKGLAREMAKLLENHDEFVKNCFGDENTMGACYFANGMLGDTILASQITDNNLQDNLYDIIASTAISGDGIAVDNSLREIEVVVPLVLQGEIQNIPDEYSENMKKSLSMIKRMGLNRNRGLGRCGLGSFIVEGSK
jgi:RAMP superfamily